MIPAPLNAGRRYVSRDIASRTPPGGDVAGMGVLVVTSAGDYASQEGLELLKKMVIRRLVAKPGDFPHLPNFGVGLLQRVKEPISGSDLVRLSAEIERQIKLEPEVKDVVVSLTFNAGLGALTVDLTILTQLGQVAPLSVTVDQLGRVRL